VAALPLMTKTDVAALLLDRVERLIVASAPAAVTR